MNVKHYNYPSDKNISPFEAVPSDSYFAYAGSFSYLGNFIELGNIEWPQDERNRHFTGEFVLLILKRYALVQNGIVIFQNENFIDGYDVGRSRFETKKYVLISDEINEYRVDSAAECDRDL